MKPKKEVVRRSLGILDTGKLVLWSGYLQQIQAADFARTIDVARHVAALDKEITFLFAFKPETYQQSFSEQQSERVMVLGGLENFGEVLDTADLFLSPIGSEKSTVSPPLTWLEAMSKGTPVITTNIRGVDEVITHNVNGFIAEDYANLADVIISAVHRPDLSRISNDAIEKVKGKFEIHQSSQDLINFWKDICS